MDQYIEALEGRCEEMRSSLEIALAEKEEVEEIRRQLTNAERSRDSAREAESKAVGLMREERDARSKDARDAKRVYDQVRPALPRILPTLPPP